MTHKWETERRFEPEPSRTVPGNHMVSWSNGHLNLMSRSGLSFRPSNYFAWDTLESELLVINITESSSWSEGSQVNEEASK